MEILSMLRSEDKFEKVEGYSILFLIVGSLTLSSGIGLTIITPKGIPAILAMLGALITFLSTVSLIFTWLLKEMIGE